MKLIMYILIIVANLLTTTTTVGIDTIVITYTNFTILAFPLVICTYVYAQKTNAQLTVQYYSILSKHQSCDKQLYTRDVTIKLLHMIDFAKSHDS